MKMENTIIMAALAYLVYKELKRSGTIGRLADATKEPNFPTTAVAGRIGRGWNVYSEPVGQKYLRRAVLTT